MGNESSHEQDAWDSKSPDGREREFENTILPPMVLLIDHVMWRPEDIIDLARQDSGPSGMPPSSSRMKVTAFLDGWEIGQPMSFPPISFPALPMSRFTKKVIPQAPSSVLTLRFGLETAQSGTTAEITIPLGKLIQYGAPLCTTLWLGLPLEGGSGFKYDIGEALARGSNPELPKVVVTLFRPARNQEFNDDPQPDVHGALHEDVDTCTGPSKRGPTAATQIKGLIKAMRSMSLTFCAMQREIFTGTNRGDNGMPQQLQVLNGRLEAQVRSLEMQVGSMNINSGVLQQDRQDVDRNCLELLEETRRENTRLQVEKAKVQEKNLLQEEHWKQQFDMQSRELRALRDSELFQKQELDRKHQELASLQDLQSQQAQNEQKMEMANTQLEELEQLKAQVQTQRGQQRYLERELNLANDELQKLRAADEQRKSLSQDHAQAQDELVRSQVSLSGVQKELAQAREELKVVPGLEKQVQYLEAELKLSRDKVDSLGTEMRAVHEDLVRAKASSETMNIEKAGTTRMLEEQISRLSGEMEAARSRDLERPEREAEAARMRVELESLRKEKDQWKQDLEAECHRWNHELESLRQANERQLELQDELAQKSIELEVMRMNAQNQQKIQDDLAKKTGEIEVHAKVGDSVLKETIEKMRAAAPQRLKDLREECAALRAKDSERLALKEEMSQVRIDKLKQQDELRELKESEKRKEIRLQEVSEELERKKGELLNMRAEREVLRTGEVLRQELVDENLAMKEELDKLKSKEATARKDLQEQLARACDELQVLRGEGANSNSEAWKQQKSQGSGVVTV